MIMKRSQQSVVLRPIAYRKAKSGLVRRLVQASDDQAKQRIRRLLVDIDDQRLLGFGLTPDDIAVLRATPESAGGYEEHGIRSLQDVGARLRTAADVKTWGNRIAS
jgi:superfamily I DNA and RNA helicase